MPRTPRPGSDRTPRPAGFIRPTGGGGANLDFPSAVPASGMFLPGPQAEKILGVMIRA